MEQLSVRLRSCALFKPRNLALLLAFMTIISRLFFQPNSVESFDAVNYILAISHFDMSLGQPQPPGYILYILLARGLNLFTQNPHLALLLLSNIASGLAVYAIYLAAKVIFDERTGLISAVLLASAPFFWYTGDLASPYATDLFISILFAWLAFHTMNEPTNSKLPWMAAILCGLAGAFRLQTILFIFPLFIFSIRKRSFRTILGSTLLVILVFAAFFIPSILASGGIAQFKKLFGETIPIVSSTVQFATEHFPAPFHLQYIYYSELHILRRRRFALAVHHDWPCFFLEDGQAMA